MLLEDNFAFEWMIHLMELSVVIGIGVVVWYIKSHQSQKDEHESRTHPTNNPDASTDSDQSD